MDTETNSWPCFHKRSPKGSGSTSVPCTTASKLLPPGLWGLRRLKCETTSAAGHCFSDHPSPDENAKLHIALGRESTAAPQLSLCDWCVAIYPAWDMNEMYSYRIKSPNAAIHQLQHSQPDITKPGCSCRIFVCQQRLNLPPCDVVGCIARIPNTLAVTHSRTMKS